VRYGPVNKLVATSVLLPRARGVVPTGSDRRHRCSHEYLMTSVPSSEWPVSNSTTVTLTKGRGITGAGSRLAADRERCVGVAV
jgi:hypothetical protein